MNAHCPDTKTLSHNRGWKCYLLGLCAVAGINISIAAPGDILYVQVDKVAFREVPKSDGQIVMELNRGQRLMEIDREGDWIYVGADGTGGKIAWLPISAVGSDKPSGGNSVPESDAFIEFRKSFDEINTKISSQTETKVLLRNPVYKGDGIIVVNPTEAWASVDSAKRDRYLNLLFSHWSLLEGTGLPIAIYVQNQNGDTLSKSQRRN